MGLATDAEGLQFRILNRSKVQQLEGVELKLIGSIRVY